MTTTKKPWRLEEAQEPTFDLRELLLPACKRIEVAGSIRRGKQDVGDIELLCIPKTTEQTDLFGESLEPENHLNRMLDELVASGNVLEKRPNRKGHFTYGPQNKLLLHVPTGIPVDVFTADERNWGMSLLVRTGSREFNIRVMRRFRDLGMKGHAYGGVTDQDGTVIDCPDEETVFDLLGWRYIAPEYRR